MRASRGRRGSRCGAPGPPGRPHRRPRAPAAVRRGSATSAGGPTLERGAVDAGRRPEGAVDDVRRRARLRHGEVVPGQRVGCRVRRRRPRATAPSMSETVALLRGGHPGASAGLPLTCSRVRRRRAGRRARGASRRPRTRPRRRRGRRWPGAGRSCWSPAARLSSSPRAARADGTSSSRRRRAALGRRPRAGRRGRTHRAARGVEQRAGDRSRPATGRRAAAGGDGRRRTLCSSSHACWREPARRMRRCVDRPRSPAGRGRAGPHRPRARSPAVARLRDLDRGPGRRRGHADLPQPVGGLAPRRRPPAAPGCRGADDASAGPAWPPRWRPAAGARAGRDRRSRRPSRERPSASAPPALLAGLVGGRGVRLRRLRGGASEGRTGASGSRGGCGPARFRCPWARTPPSRTRRAAPRATRARRSAVTVYVSPDRASSVQQVADRHPGRVAAATGRGSRTPTRTARRCRARRRRPTSMPLHRAVGVPGAGVGGRTGVPRGSLCSSAAASTASPSRPCAVGRLVGDPDGHVGQGREPRRRPSARPAVSMPASPGDPRRQRVGDRRPRRRRPRRPHQRAGVLLDRGRRAAQRSGAARRPAGTGCVR